MEGSQYIVSTDPSTVVKQEVISHESAVSDESIIHEQEFILDELQCIDKGYEVHMPSSPVSTTTLVPAAPPVHHGDTSGGISSAAVSSMKPILMHDAMVMQQVGSINTVPTNVIPCTIPLPALVQTPSLPHYTNHTAIPTADLQEVQLHPTVLQTLSHVETAPQEPISQYQPVDLNHALNYVNKIKKRFQGQPDKYKRFLEILHTYHMEQRNLKVETGVGGGQVSGSKQLTVVYSQITRLFEHQEDLLAQFGQFLPDPTYHQTTISNCKCEEISVSYEPSVGIKMSSSYNSDNASRTSANLSPVQVESGSADGLSMCTPVITAVVHTDPGQSSGLRSLSMHHHPPTRKYKLSSFKNVSLEEAETYGTLNDYAFFDKVHKALQSQNVYENFLRCLILFNHEIVTKGELVLLATPFLRKFPELFRWLKEYLVCDCGDASIHVPCDPSIQGEPVMCGNIMNNIAHQERPTGDQAMDIDYATCKRLGTSYCALPENYPVPKCSGRTALCKEVLNDTWVSFPVCSEESTFVTTSRKIQCADYINRCEDERFELDVVLETNAATIHVLEGVLKKLCRLSSKEVAKFRLDDCLGGTSPTIHQCALRRIYGDKAADIIDGLKTIPVVVVPIVLRRLKAKAVEWRDAQKGFNKIWREQTEKILVKRYHQSINLKKNDIKFLFNETETDLDGQHDEEVIRDTIPHMIFQNKDKSVLDGTANLLTHNVKRQKGIHKEYKQKIK